MCLNAGDICRAQSDSTSIRLGCTVPEVAQPRSTPTRMWFKDDQLVFSSLVGGRPDPNPDFFRDNQILMKGVVFDFNPLAALSDGSLVYFHAGAVMNITMPGLLPPGINNLEQARREVFRLSLGTWRCVVNNTLGIASVTYEIRECGK